MVLQHSIYLCHLCRGHPNYRVPVNGVDNCILLVLREYLKHTCNVYQLER
jgi:hypothetical protein